MENWQTITITILVILAILFFIVGLINVKRGKAYQKFWPLNIIGAFVWGDAIIFGPFWIVSSVVSLWLKNWQLFEIIFLCFWLVRSLGETIYWFLQQFSEVKREPPERIWFYRFVKSDAVWFIFQIWWQCITIVSLVLLILLLR